MRSSLRIPLLLSVIGALGQAHGAVSSNPVEVARPSSVIFMKEASGENETSSSSNAEPWSGRQWTMIIRRNGGSDITFPFDVTIKDPTDSSPEVVDNPSPPLFTNGNKTSNTQSFPAGSNCIAVDPNVETNTLSGNFPTEVTIHYADGDVTVDTGHFYVSKLDAHGVGSSTRVKFPDYAMTLPRKPGTLSDPVIQMDSGGDASSSGCSLYGWTDAKCPPTNVWNFTAVVRDPITHENLPAGYSIKWRLSTFQYMTPSSTEIPGLEVTGTKNGQPEKVKITLPVGRWFPRLEVWFTDPKPPAGTTAQPELVSVAELHSLVVEAYPGSNVAGKNDPVVENARYGAPFALSNHAGGLTVDARMRITGSPSRGRVSLDGYPQNQYWVTAGDVDDLAQVAAIPHKVDQVCYLQGYINPSQSADDLQLVVEGQAQNEVCLNCSVFEELPAVYSWQETDREPFSAYDVYMMSVDGSGNPADTHGVPGSVPAPIITVSQSQLQLTQGLSGTLSVSGTIRSGTCDVIPGDQGKITAMTITRGSDGQTLGSISVTGNKGSDPTNLRRPYPFDGTFSGSISVSNLDQGSTIFTLIAEDPLRGHQGRYSFLVNVGPVGNTTPSTSGPFASLTSFAQPLGLRFDASGVTSLRDLAGLRQPIAIAGIGTDLEILDLALNRITRLDKAGKILSRWGQPGTGVGQFSSPQQLAGLGGRVALLDSTGHRIQTFAADGGSAVAASAASGRVFDVLVGGASRVVAISTAQSAWQRWDDTLHAVDSGTSTALSAVSQPVVGSLSGNDLVVVTAARHLIHIILPAGTVSKDVALSPAIATSAVPIAVVSDATRTLATFSDGSVADVTAQGVVTVRHLSDAIPPIASTRDGNGHLCVLAGVAVDRYDLTSFGLVDQFAVVPATVPVTATPLTDATVGAIVDHAAVTSSSGLQFELVGEAQFQVIVNDADLLVLDHSSTAARSLHVAVNYGPWNLQQLPLTLVETAPGSRIFAVGFTQTDATLSADAKTLTLVIDGVTPPSLLVSTSDAHHYASADGKWQAVLKPASGSLSTTAVDGITLSVTGPTAATGVRVVDLLETSAVSRHFTTQALRSSTVVSGGGGYRVLSTSTVFTNSKEEFSPVVFAIRGIFSSDAIIPTTAIDIRSLDGKKRAVRRSTDGKYYLGRDDKPDVAVLVGSPEGVYDAP